MSQKQAKYITTAAFPEPNYTQTPNAFFEMIPDMEHSELAVTLIMIRNTFGFHKATFKLGISKLADAAGLSRNATKDGAEAAESRGTFRRTNPNEQGEAEWELVVGQPVTPLTDCMGVGQPVTPPPSINDPQVRLKETKETPKKGDLVDAILDQERQAIGKINYPKRESLPEPIRELIDAFVSETGIKPMGKEAMSWLMVGQDWLNLNASAQDVRGALAYAKGKFAIMTPHSLTNTLRAYKSGYVAKEEPTRIEKSFPL